MARKVSVKETSKAAGNGAVAKNGKDTLVLRKPESASGMGPRRKFQKSVRHYLKYVLGREWATATELDFLHAISLAVRERIIDSMHATEKRYRKQDAKRMAYLSMEFLIGQSLLNTLHNLGAHEYISDAVADMGIDLGSLAEHEVDAALGNGGLGRLAACFLDSLATLGMPGFGYGINYEFGLFRQEIHNGNQKEKPDSWFKDRSPWLIEHPDEAVLVPVYGRIEHAQDYNGCYNPMWMDWQVIVGVPCDMPVVGYGGKTVNSLRLFTARASDEFDMEIFNSGDYFHAVQQKISTETISKVLYPSDDMLAGKALRLIQEYFLVACAIRDIVRKFKREFNTFALFPQKVAIQLNDTHPALAVTELLRTLIDENDLSWEEAWQITTQTLAFTNHTLLPEALEKWPIELLERVLPRHAQLIFEINHRFLKTVAQRWPGDTGRIRKLSLIEEGQERQVRMAHLAIVGSHSVNGVAQLHSRLVKTSLVPDFHELWPEKFNNKTNGITQRRWLLKSNPDLADLLHKTIGDLWITDLEQLRGLEPLSKDRAFQNEFQEIKLGNKLKLAALIKKTTQQTVDPHALFDIHCKRIHEYKRQLLNVLHIIHQYLQIVEDGKDLAVPRVYIFSGKAAPGYHFAKLIIKLIHSVAAAAEAHPQACKQLQVVFVPDYRVSLAERIIPAADISEQISTAGTEASGTGNMKFALNGALTVGTWDGANIEIAEEVGEENIYIFGLRTEKIEELERSGSYDPSELLDSSPAVARVLRTLHDDVFSPGEPGLFRPIYDRLVGQGDPYYLLADLDDYIRTQRRAGADFRKKRTWLRKAITNVARIGKFSSDRTIREYARDIWDIKSVV